MMGGIEMRMVDKPGKSGFQTFKHCYDAGVNFEEYRRYSNYRSTIYM